MDILAYLDEISAHPEKYMKAPGNERVDADGIAVIEGVFREGACIGIAPNPRGADGFMHRHSFIEIGYCLRGSAQMQVQGRNVVLEQGDFCILDLQCAHTLKLVPADSLLLDVMVKPKFFDEAFFQHFYSSSPLTSFFAQAVYSEKREQRFLLFHTGDNADIRYTFLRMAKEYYQEDISSREIIESLLMILFAESIRLSSRDPARCTLLEQEGDLPALGSIIGYLNANLSTATRQSVAEHLGYSYSHVSKIIQAATGGSFTELRNRLRLQRADSLLCSTDLPVEQISVMAGFSNVSAFYKLFRAAHGMRPQEFRKAYRQEE